MKAAPKLDVLPEVTAATKTLAPALKRLTKSLAALDPKDIPIGALADTLYELRQLGKLLGSITAPFDDILAPVIKQTEEFFINQLAVGEASGTQGKKARVQITESIIPTIEDWPKFYAHIKKTGQFELLNRAPNKLSIQERWADRKSIPGVNKFHAKKVSCTKLSGK